MSVGKKVKSGSSVFSANVFRRVNGASISVSTVHRFGETVSSTQRTFQGMAANDAAQLEGWASQYGINLNSITAFNDSSSIQPSHIATPWSMTTSYNATKHIPTWVAEDPQNRQYVLSQSLWPTSWETSNGTGGNNTAAQRVINGELDSSIIAQAQRWVTLNMHVNGILRLGWEMNTYGSQYPWGYGRTDSALYVGAWRRWAQIYKQYAPTVKLEWCVLLDSRPPTSWWPGDDVVDVIGSDPYGTKWMSTSPSETELRNWLATGATCSLAWMRQFRQDHPNANGTLKPFSFSEYAMASPTATPIGQMGNKGSGDHPSVFDAYWSMILEGGCSHHTYWNSGQGGIVWTLDNVPNLRAKYIQRFHEIEALYG